MIILILDGEFKKEQHKNTLKIQFPFNLARLDDRNEYLRMR